MVQWICLSGGPGLPGLYCGMGRTLVETLSACTESAVKVGRLGYQKHKQHTVVSSVYPDIQGDDSEAADSSRIDLTIHHDMNILPDFLSVLIDLSQLSVRGKSESETRSRICLPVVLTLLLPDSGLCRFS